TNIAVFVGYTHPTKSNRNEQDEFGKTVTKSNFGEAIQVFSFADYERYFGGFFSPDDPARDLANTVNQFFLNGGTMAYVVALRPPGAVPAAVSAANIEFTPLELPTTQAEMSVRVFPASGGDRADIQVT